MNRWEEIGGLVVMRCGGVGLAGWLYSSLKIGMWKDKYVEVKIDGQLASMAQCLSHWLMGW